jgi:hypothetical protein
MKPYLSIVLFAIAAAGCSQSETSPSPTHATGASVQNIVTNAPGGIPAPSDTGGNSCASITPSVRIESDWPKANHVSVDWGHADGYAYVEITFPRRDTDPLQVVTVKPNEHTNGAGQVSHHTEVVLPLAIYNPTVTFITSTGCRSKTAAFNGLNHGIGSLTGSPDAPKG